MRSGFHNAGRLWLMVIAVTGCFGFIFFRLLTLHVLERESLAQEADRSRQRFEVVESRRGNIMDARGNLLAATRAVIEVGLDPQAIGVGDMEKLPALAELLDMPLDELKSIADQRVRVVKSESGTEMKMIRWRKLSDSVDQATYDKIRAIGIRAVYGNRKYERTYPGGALAAHLIGFVNRESTPVQGVERIMDFYLRGQSGWKESERDGRRRELSQFRHREVEPRNGLHVQLSVDWTIQHMVEAEIQRIVSEYNPKGVSVIVSEPNTGAILALANYPTFDPNHFNLAPLDHLRNRALTDVYEPGSTFKIVPAAGALNDGLVQLDELFDCAVGSAEYRGRLVKLPGDSHPMGMASVREIVVKSSNRGAAHLGIRLGAQRLYDYSAAFGFGERTGIGMLGESAGVLHEVRNWDGLTISRLPMGHAISATPLQVHYAMSVIANGGILMEPHLVRRVLDDEGQTVVAYQPRAKRRVIASDTARLMAGMLAEVTMPGGTARRAAIDGFTVAGKTGTTQKLVNGRYSSQHHVASFSGFFPVERPRVVISIVVDEPQIPGPGYGGLVAAPAFHNLGEQIIPYLGIQPDRDHQQRYLAGKFTETATVP